MAAYYCEATFEPVNTSVLFELDFYVDFITLKNVLIFIKVSSAFELRVAYICLLPAVENLNC